MRWRKVIRASLVALAVWVAGEGALLMAEQISVDNGQVKVTANRIGKGYGRLDFFARVRQKWSPLATWQPMVCIVYDGQQGEVNWQPVLAHGRVKGTTMDFSDQLADPDGGRWQVRLTISLDRNEPVAKIRCEWRCSSDRRVKALWGPNLFVGESDAKLGAYCPALNSFTMANLLPTHEISPHHFTTEELPTRES